MTLSGVVKVMQNSIYLSFVIPCYRSEHTILKVVDEIEETMKSHPEIRFEIILVNDGSPDRVWETIWNRSQNDWHVIGINLAKNFGQHCALMAGYHQAQGEYIISLDDDGQSPVSDVFSLLEAVDKGYDVVYASYPEKKESQFRRLGSDFAQRMTHYMLDVKEKFPKGSSFFVMKSYVKDEIIKYEHPYPYLAGLIFRTTRNICMIPLSQREREHGQSGYTLKSLISLWMNGFTAFSVKPLEFGAIVGFAFAILGFICAVIIVVRKLIYPQIPTTGWSSLLSMLLIIGGMIMIMLGFIGEYIGRIYICLNKSPQFVVKDIVKKD